MKILKHAALFSFITPFYLNQPILYYYQVSGYGENGTGDANDVFRLEVVGGNEGEVVKAVVHK